MANGKNGKIEYKVKASVSNTKNYHKIVIPGEALGQNIRWKQTVYLPGQKKGKA